MSESERPRYTEMEVNYMASFLKKKSTKSTEFSILDEVFDRGKNTIEHLQNSMIAQDIQAERILELYS